jgi:adenylate cyclase
MNVTLESLATCFQGLLPAMLFTCSQDGVPNAAYLSHVDYVDARHVALSYQFFNKSRRNIAENPHGLVMVPDPDTGQGWQLRLLFVRSETEGPLFERMALRIEAIASYSGLKGIFKLRAADVYEVLSIEPSLEEPATSVGTLFHPTRGSGLPPAVFTMKALQDLADRIQRTDSLESLVDAILAGLEESFGFRNSMILVPAEEAGVLVTIATRGYPQNGSGAEARIGEGIVGLVAEARKPIRISGLMRGMLYPYAMHHGSQDAQTAALRGRIPLPGLPNPESQLGVPLMVRGELVGVLCLESDSPYRFHEEDKSSIELLGNYLAIAIQNMQLHEERTTESVESLTIPSRAATSAVSSLDTRATPTRQVVYHRADECITVDNAYLIRSLPARILWRLLKTHEQTGRNEFTNRELRLDKSLNLPDFKDNLETRLLLLRRRLEYKCPDIKIVTRARGRFALELGCALVLGTEP